MANDLFFSRDTRVVVSDGTAYWEIPVLDGFSFSQATNTSEISLAEMSSAASGNKSRRGRRMFNDSYAPAEWSFSTYARPFKSATGNIASGWDALSVQAHAVEEVLWAALVGNGVFTRGATGDPATNSAWSTNQGMANTASALTIDFSDADVASLKELDIYFVMGQGTYASGTHTVYKIEGCVVNSAGIDFDIEGITTINWSGFGKLITEQASDPTATITEGASSTSNFIRNRLTTLAVTNDGDGALETAYNLTLTGGSLNFENNLTYITPETLGVINQPFAAVTGTLNIGGSFTCYLGNHTAGSADLFEDLIESTSLITNDFNLVFTIGGATAPNIQVTLPTCHLEVPTHSIEDIISLETTFHALPSTIDATDEATIVYNPA
jgi:hypothetical protein